MVTISILVNTVRPSDNQRLDDTTFGLGTFSWQDPEHSWKAGLVEVMTVENLFVYLSNMTKILNVSSTLEIPRVSKVQEFQKSQMSQMDPMFKNYQGSYRFPKTQKSKGC